MTDGDALRGSVVANPDDDTPRLIYADWLDENAQPDRAAFIRAQVEAALAELFSPQSHAATARAATLLEIHRKAWTGHLPGKFIGHPGFMRGFINHLTVEPTGFVPSAGAIFATEPVQALRLVRSADVSGWLSLLPIFELPQLHQIRRLEFTTMIGLLHDEYVGLTTSPHLAGLRDLSLRENPIHPPWLSETLTSDVFPNLVGLDVADIPNLGPRLTEAFAGAHHRNLLRLNVSGVVFTSDQMQRVLTSRCLRRIEELRLGWSGRPGAPGPLFHLDLGWVIPWDHLTVLDLAGQRLGDEGVRAIAARKEATALRWLGLSDNVLGREGVRLLVTAKHLTLYHLDVRGNGLSRNDVVALKERFPDAVVLS